MFESILSEFDAAFPKKKRDKGLPQSWSKSPEKRRRAGLMQGHGAPGVSATSAPKSNWRSDDQHKDDAESTKPQPSPSTMRKAWRTGDSKGGQHRVPEGVKDSDKVAAQKPGQAIARAKERASDAAAKGEKPRVSSIGMKLPGFRQRERAGTAQWQKSRARNANESIGIFGDLLFEYKTMITEKAIVDPFKKDWEKPPDTDEFKRTKGAAKERDHERRYKEAGRVKKAFMKKPPSQKKPKSKSGDRWYDRMGPI